MNRALLLAGLAAATILAVAQTPATGPVLRLTATTDNVSGAPDSVRIDLLRWSTDAERDQFLTAWTKPGASPGRGGKGPAAIDQSDPALADANPAGGGRGGGRGGRGGGRGGEAATPPPTPEGSLAAALDKANTLGYVWSSEVAGYAVRYAVQVTEPDGGQHVVLITDRRLGASNDLWKPASGSATNYDFSVIELHLNSKGEGEGKASLTGKVAVDSAAKTFALENYSTLPVILKNVRRK
jgi:hypothetical protein